jgi:hypothetical protein
MLDPQNAAAKKIVTIFRQSGDQEMVKILIFGKKKTARRQGHSGRVGKCPGNQGVIVVRGRRQSYVGQNLE